MGIKKKNNNNNNGCFRVPIVTIPDTDLHFANFYAPGTGNEVPVGKKITTITITNSRSKMTYKSGKPGQTDLISGILSEIISRYVHVDINQRTLPTPNIPPAYTPRQFLPWQINLPQKNTSPNPPDIPQKFKPPDSLPNMSPVKKLPLHNFPKMPAGRHCRWAVSYFLHYFHFLVKAQML